MARASTTPRTSRSPPRSCGRSTASSACSRARRHGTLFPLCRGPGRRVHLRPPPRLSVRPARRGRVSVAGGARHRVSAEARPRRARRGGGARLRPLGPCSGRARRGTRRAGRAGRRQPDARPRGALSRRGSRGGQAAGVLRGSLAGRDATSAHAGREPGRRDAGGAIAPRSRPPHPALVRGARRHVGRRAHRPPVRAIQGRDVPRGPAFSLRDAPPSRCSRGSGWDGLVSFVAARWHRAGLAGLGAVALLAYGDVVATEVSGCTPTRTSTSAGSSAARGALRRRSRSPTTGSLTGRPFTGSRTTRPRTTVPSTSPRWEGPTR